MIALSDIIGKFKIWFFDQYISINIEHFLFARYWLVYINTDISETMFIHWD